MRKKVENIELEQQPVSTRRTVIKWMGQIISGASIAAVALGFADPERVFATPGCIKCPTGCVVTKCIGNPPCSEHLRYYVDLAYYTGGCANPNCPTSCSYVGCAAGCSCCP